MVSAYSECAERGDVVVKSSHLIGIMAKYNIYR
jgi:hypothetical protein